MKRFILLAGALLTTSAFAGTQEDKHSSSMNAIRSAWKTHQTTQAQPHNGLAIVYGGADVALDPKPSSHFIPV